MEISNVFAHRAQTLKEAIETLQEAETKMSGFLHFISCSDCQIPLLIKLISCAATDKELPPKAEEKKTRWLVDTNHRRCYTLEQKWGVMIF